MSYFDELLSKVSFDNGDQMPFPAVAVAQEQEAAKQNNPLDAYTEAGIPPEKAEEIANYKPGTPFTDIFTQNIAKPTAPDPEKNKKNLRAASIAQALGILADAFGASQGALVQKRGDNPVGAVVGEQKRLQDLYEQKLDRYNQSLASAMMQDAGVKRAWEEKKEGRVYNERIAREGRVAEQKNRLETIKAQQDKEITVANERPRTTTTATKSAQEKPTKQTYTPKQRIEIDTEYNKIPADWLAKKGYAVKKTRKVPDPRISGRTTDEEYWEVKSINDYEMKQYLVQQWDAEKEKEADNNPPPPPPPARPGWSTNATQQTKKKIPGF